MTIKMTDRLVKEVLDYVILKDHVEDRGDPELAFMINEAVAYQRNKIANQIKKVDL